MLSVAVLVSAMLAGKVMYPTVESVAVEVSAIVEITDAKDDTASVLVNVSSIFAGKVM